MLHPSEVTTSWGVLKPLLDNLSDSNEMLSDPYFSEQILMDVHGGYTHILAGFEDEDIKLILVISFAVDRQKEKSVDIIGISGKDLTRYKRLFWDQILDWFRAEGVSYVDTLATPRMAEIYKRKFGFNKSCVAIRMDL